MISGFCGFGVLVMSGCACACDKWWWVVVGDVGCNLVHVWVSVAKCCDMKNTGMSYLCDIDTSSLATTVELYTFCISLCMGSKWVLIIMFFKT